MASMGLGVLSWNWLPLLPIFGVYFISGPAETNRAPFDVVEGESEIVAGSHGRVRRHVVRDVHAGRVRQHDPGVDPRRDHVPRRLAEPVRFPGLDPGLDLAGHQGLCADDAVPLVRATFPRYRYDQIMRLGWKVFIPVTLVWLVLVGLGCRPANIWK